MSSYLLVGSKMDYNIMNYKLMRARKYYDAVKTNKSFLNAPLGLKIKIITNILRFFGIQSKKPLTIKNKPVTAQIEPTSECNLRCKMCIRETTGIPIGRMSFEDFKKILDKLDSLYKIGLSGQGELFMHPELFKMIDYSNKRGILVNLNSNGTLITKSIIEKICKTDIGEIGISVDSPKKEEYEEIRVGARYNRLLENIKNLTTALKKNNRKTIVTMTPIIFKNNIKDLPEFVDLAKKVGIKKISFQTLQTKENYLTNYGKDMKSQIITKDIEKLKKKMKEAKELGEKYGITIIFDEDESPGCIWPWRGIYIMWNGDVTACCKVVEAKNTLGNILKQDFWEVWNGEKYQELRRLLKERKTPSYCKGCNRV
jgi:radical SAM protein with 4Fe4S-binding SPASM domain